MWRWSACAFSSMGILCRLNIPRVRIIHSSSLTGLKWKGTRMYMGAGGGWSAHLGLSDQHRWITPPRGASIPRARGLPSLSTLYNGPKIPRSAAVAQLVERLAVKGRRDQ